MSKTALFTNFTVEEFVGYWNGKGRKYPPGASEYMPDYLARHFAKHLTNRELLRKDKSGNPLYPDGEKMTSPKFPEQVPLFMQLFNKAYTPDSTDEVGVSAPKDDVDSLIQSANKNRAEKGAVGLSNDLSPVETGGKPDPTKPQVISVPDDGDDEQEFPKT